MDKEKERENKALSVSNAEAGQKLLNFLQRRVCAADSEFHRWIRTGQVRVNGARIKAFARINEGDIIRIPPFAERLPVGETCPAFHSRPSRLNILFEDDDILVLSKPAGLPVQGGTGHEESIASILADERKGAAFVPAPAHRLDKDTSGLLIAGKTYRAARILADLFSGKGKARPIKEYLAWVEGSWPLDSPSELTDILAKDRKEQRVKADASPASMGKKASSIVSAVEYRKIYGRPCTLLLIRLLTGRMHQIRVQLSSRGYPIVGDPWYGNKDVFFRESMKLHAFRLSIPVPPQKNRIFELPPPWKYPWAYSGAAQKKSSAPVGAEPFFSSLMKEEA